MKKMLKDNPKIRGSFMSILKRQMRQRAGKEGK